MTDNVFAPPQAKLDVHEGPEVLWQMSWKDLRKLYLASVNVRALGVLYGLGAFGAIVAAIFFFVGTIGTSNGGAAPGILAAVVAVFGLIYVAACVSSYTRPTWGRWLGIVVCVLGLFSFPLGTLIGIMGLIAYAQGGKLFGPDRLPHNDVAVVYKQRKKDKK
jgi:hypothetical protein